MSLYKDFVDLNKTFIKEYIFVKDGLFGLYLYVVLRENSQNFLDFSMFLSENCGVDKLPQILSEKEFKLLRRALNEKF